MDPLVFAQENVAILEMTIDEARSTKVRTDSYRWNLEEDLRCLIENTQLIIDILKNRITKESS